MPSYSSEIRSPACKSRHCQSTYPNLTSCFCWLTQLIIFQDEQSVQKHTLHRLHGTDFALSNSSNLQSIYFLQGTHLFFLSLSNLPPCILRAQNILVPTACSQHETGTRALAKQLEIVRGSIPPALIDSIGKVPNKKTLTDAEKMIAPRSLQRDTSPNLIRRCTRWHLAVAIGRELRVNSLKPRQFFP